MSSSGESVSTYSLEPAVLAIYYVFCVIALITVLLRCYVRLRLTGDWGWDETLIIVAWAALLAGLVMIQLAANHGLGKHVEYVSEHNVEQTDKFNTFFQMVDVICALLTKISISFFILRLKDTKRFRWILISLMTLMTLATLQVIILEIVSCRPMKKSWDPSVSGSCLPSDTVLISANVQSGFTIFTDLCLTASPIVILWKVQISVKRKIQICGLMSLGLMATVCNILRNVYQARLDTPDVTYNMVPVVIVSILELAFGIIAACIPACMPLFKWHGRKKLPMSRYLVSHSATQFSSTRHESMSGSTSTLDEKSAPRSTYLGRIHQSLFSRFAPRKHEHKPQSPSGNEAGPARQ